MSRIITLIMCLALTAGCGSFFSDSKDSGGGNNPPPPPPTVGSGNLGAANNSRLLPADDSGLAWVVGELLVEGFTILDENQNVVNPDESGLKLLARLVDPGDDILSEVSPGIDGKYELHTAENLVEAKLQVEFWVAEDVDGDGQGNDLIVHTVPVQLVKGFISRVSMFISPGSIHNLAPELFGAGDAGISSVVVSVERSDGNGEYDELFALFPDGLLYVDDDNDEFIEPGEDSFWEDSDRNGWSDIEEEAYQQSAMLSWIYLEARVLSVNIADQTMFVIVDYAESFSNVAPPQFNDILIGKIIQVRKQSYTVLEGLVLPSDLGLPGSLAPEEIGFTDSFLIDDTLVDQPVIIQGVYDGNTVEADVIYELSKETGVPVEGQF